MEQLDKSIILFGLSTALAALVFILWMIVKNQQVRKGGKIYNLPNEIPGEGVDIRFSEQPYYEC